MDAVDNFDIIGFKDGIKHCFSSVFSELNLATEGWVQKTHLLTIGRENYAEFIAAKVGLVPLFATSRFVPVEATYVRVNITTEFEREKYRSVSQIEDALRRQKAGEDVDNRRETSCSPLEAINSTEGGFALIGSPGTGKTTAFRYLTVCAARGEKIRGKSRIPVYLAARDLADGQEILSAACNLFLQWEITEPERVLKALLKNGNCIILVDGIDEVDNIYQKKILAELTEIQARYPHSIVCISARPYSLSVGISNFSKWETLPLSLEERLIFVQKWYAAIDNVKGELLVQKSVSRPEILDLGSNPLLLSIVCALFYNDLDIPLEPDELYERAIHGIMGGWDIFRNIARQTVLADLPIRKRIVLVNLLASALFEKRKLVFSSTCVDESGILSSAAQLIQFEEFEASGLLSSLYNDFGLLIERSPNTYSFSHLTFHEFLVAQNIVNNRGEIQLVSSYRNDQRWSEVICLVAKMLSNADSFISQLHATTRWHKKNDVSLIEEVWRLNPICSKDTRKKLLRDIANQVANASKVGNSFEFQDSILVVGNPSEKSVRVVTDYLRKRKKNDRLSSNENTVEALGNQEKDKKGKETGLTSPLWLIMIETVPLLINMVRDSEFTPEDLGVATNPLFRKWIECGMCEVNEVKIINAEKVKKRHFTKNSRCEI